MRLKSIRVINYKGFADSEAIELGKHWTVVVGRNNVGKTALLEAFPFGQFVDKPHLSIDQDPTRPRVPESQSEILVEIMPSELQQFFLRAGGNIAVPVQDKEHAKVQAREVFWGSDPLSFLIYRTGQVDWRAREYPSHRLFGWTPDKGQIAVGASVSSDRQRVDLSNPVGTNADNLPGLVGGAVTASTYVFRPERRVAGRSSVEHHLILSPDAGNLAGVLHYLYTDNPTHFQNLVNLVRQVLPDITAITVPPSPASGVQILVWNSGFIEGRRDLAIPLEECGTGVGQVLAILFVVATAETPKIIVIDEPNSFLHPGASRVLMNLLRAQEMHQFIVTTHSPEILTATEPDRVALVQWQDNQSRVQGYEGAALSGVRSAFDELGVRLSDVYGYDAVIWLEGSTEAKCFPALLRASQQDLPARTAFVPLVQTGDFEGRSARTIWQAYRQLAQRSALVPQTISISFDREGKTEQLCTELSIESDGLIRFLPRRTYENYLLHSGSIAAVMREVDEDCLITSGEIEQWLGRHRFASKYYRGRNVPKDDQERSRWLIDVDAPKLLHDLIGALTENKQDFKGNKVKYSFMLTQWMIRNAPEELSDAIDYVKSLLTR